MLRVGTGYGGECEGGGSDIIFMRHLLGARHCSQVHTATKSLHPLVHTVPTNYIYCI